MLLPVEMLETLHADLETKKHELEAAEYGVTDCLSRIGKLMELRAEEEAMAMGAVLRERVAEVEVAQVGVLVSMRNIKLALGVE